MIVVRFIAILTLPPPPPAVHGWAEAGGAFSYKPPGVDSIGVPCPGCLGNGALPPWQQGHAALPQAGAAGLSWSLEVARRTGLCQFWDFKSWWYWLEMLFLNQHLERCTFCPRICSGVAGQPSLHAPYKNKSNCLGTLFIWLNAIQYLDNLIWIISW